MLSWPKLLFFLSLQMLWAPVLAQEAISFRNDVMAVLSKAGCNAGACHGNANGKGGFKLSLRGESPEQDFISLAQEQLSRRINLLEPEESLILQKATTRIAHEGGERFTQSSPEYNTLLQWIAGGATNDLATAAVPERLEVSPSEVFLIEPQNTVQITVRAVFTDGSSRDVTSLAVYEPSNPSVTVSSHGLVAATPPAESAVLVRFLEKQVTVRLAFIPERPGFVWIDPSPRNYIDQLVFTRLKRLRINPSELCTDEAFVRRAYLDLLGRIPSVHEARAFVLEHSANKRARLVDVLLQRPEFADFWALKWSDLLRNEERILDRKGSEVFHQWVRDSIRQSKPLDQFAREILSARGSTYRNPPANFYRATRTPVERGEAVAQLFLGTQVQCAQCHNHPFDRWSQDDYYDWMRLFARLDYKVLENRRRDNNDKHEFKGEQIVFTRPTTNYKNARTGAPANPRFLGEAQTVAPGEDELISLSEWLTRDRQFARVQANRIWFHLFGRGIVEPIDDFRASNPPVNPDLLEALTDDLINHSYDLRHLIRTIMNSRVYQLSSVPNESNAADESNFSRSLLRRLSAEQLLDSLFQATGVPLRFTGYPLGTRAVQLAGALPERKRDQRKTEVDHFLEEFGKPPRLLVSECERSCNPTMGQAFQLVSGPVLHELVSSPANVLNQLLKSGKSDPDLVPELFWSALSRPPTKEELNRLSEYLTQGKEKRAGLEDILWSLLSSNEFLLR